MTGTEAPLTFGRCRRMTLHESVFALGRSWSGEGCSIGECIRLC